MMVLFIQECWSITASDIYTRLLEKERNIDKTFAFQFVKPIGSVAGELIWPRSYSTSSELMFDENGAAYKLHERPSLSRILQISRSSSLNGNNVYRDTYNNLRS
uniref:Cytokin_check_N domain-containing protein n=1 Tax=Heterorhabditis bacteriophora TaxID=37862 RepID=A0A1I7WLF1_HETBA